MSHAPILVVRICLSLHTDTIYGDVSVRNTSGALTLVRITPLYSYRYAIPSHYYMHAVPWIDYCTIVTIHHYRNYSDICSTEVEACTERNTTWYSLLRLLTILLLSTTAGA